MGASIHAQDTNVMSSKTILFYGVSCNSVCPNFSFVDVSHVSTSMSRKNNMKKMVPSNPFSNQKNMRLPLLNFSGSIMDFDDNY
jgi:hypothetical protein